MLILAFLSLSLSLSLSIHPSIYLSIYLPLLSQVSPLISLWKVHRVATASATSLKTRRIVGLSTRSKRRRKCRGNAIIERKKRVRCLRGRTKKAGSVVKSRRLIFYQSLLLFLCLSVSPAMSDRSNSPEVGICNG